MVRIVETIKEFQEIDTAVDDSWLVIPLFKHPHQHPAVNPLCCIYLYSEHYEFLLTFDHNDADRLPPHCLYKLESLLKTVEVRTPSKKDLLYVFPTLRDALDLDAFEDSVSNTMAPTVNFKPSLMMRADRLNTSYSAVPIMVIIQYFEKFSAHLRQFMHSKTLPNYEFLNNTIIPVCYDMEKKGIFVDADKFIKYYGPKTESLIHDGFVFSDYNTYTNVGRVTNHYGGINFSAVNKSDGTREAFVSRFENGRMVLIDFESFHLRLISEMIGFDAPSGSFHTYLGRLYFGTYELSAEMYDLAKKTTFKQLYSSDRDLSIPFFAAVQEWEDAAWTELCEKGFLVMAENRVLYLSEMESPSKSKMFNYILQWLETVTVFKLLKKVMPLYDDAESAVVLYTYDSILIDFTLRDGKVLLSKTAEILEDGGKYPVRIHIGRSYNELKEVTNTILPMV